MGTIKSVPIQPNELTTPCQCYRDTLLEIFSRKPRPFTTKMKATEWRQLRLYTGPVDLVNQITSERYANFFTFFVASKILSCTRFHVQYGQYAKELLRNFVQNGSILYGPTFISYNIHNLIHIADDCNRLGALDSFSAYVFENHLCVI